MRDEDNVESMQDEYELDHDPLTHRLRENPWPIVLWITSVGVLFALELGAVLSTINQVGSFGVEWVSDIPTLLSREVISNQGYQDPNGGWQGPFLGFSPAISWGLRVVLIYAYAFVWMALIWKGYDIFRTHYRQASWTPVDDMVDRFARHRWGQFGLVIVFMFIVMAIFAPALGPTTAEQNLNQPYSYEVQYYDEATGSVNTIVVGDANFDSSSRGSPEQNVGPLSYDDYGRFHPFGTMPAGKDLFTFMALGSRISLFIGAFSILLASAVATIFALMTAYYKGLTDLAVVITSDSVQALPQLLVLILIAQLFSDTWIAQIYNGGFILAIIFALTLWPYLWRAVRGPAMQVSEQQWINAAKSYGQTPSVTMRKHMLPYLMGYLLIYGSLTLGGVIIAVAGLSFLGLGVNPPTPEWGRVVTQGQPYVATISWHISLIPGILIVLVVTAFNALGDGIRDALDPQSQIGVGEGESGEMAAAGGGGA